VREARDTSAHVSVGAVVSLTLTAADGLRAGPRAYQPNVFEHAGELNVARPDRGPRYQPSVSSLRMR
jgi:hypothetical protein